MRALSAIRLSVLTDETTSPERQRAANKEAMAAIGAIPAGEALDLDVSASKTAPFDRLELGAWLGTPERYDAIVWWRQDRAVRSMDDMNALSAWAKDNRKMLVFNEGPGGARLVLDFRNPLDPVTQLMTTVFAFAAQMEAQAIRDRVAGAQAALRSTPLRWRGAWPPYGYQPRKLPRGGWTLELDPYAVRIIERMITAVSEGKSWAGIAFDLQRDSVMSPQNYWRSRRGKPVTDSPWKHSTVRDILTSPTLLGYKLHQRQIVRTADGEPVRASEDAVLTREEWDSLQSVIRTKSPDTAPRRDTVNALLLGVAHCASCGCRMYLSRQGGDRLDAYKCGSRQRSVDCPGRATVRGDWLDDWAEGEFLRRLGGVKVHETRQVPGSDPRPEIEEVSAELEAHYAKQGTQRSAAARAAWERHAEALDARLAALEALPVVEAHTEFVATTQTYWDAWEAADTAGRREMLLAAGIRAEVSKGGVRGTKSLNTEKVRFRITEEFHAEAADELAALARDLM